MTTREDLHVTTGFAVTLTCGGCGHTQTLEPRANSGSRLPVEVIAKQFTRRGWALGSKPSKDRCPACNRRKPKEATAMPTPDLHIVPAPSPSEQPPREMTREHRRLIFLKLEEVYGDESTGYAAGWNDYRVAEDMAVPRNWVEVIREENFGPVKAEESEEAKALRAVIEAAEASALSLGEGVAALNRELSALGERNAKLFEDLGGVHATLRQARVDLAKLTGKVAA